MKRIECSIMTRTVGYYANFHNMHKGKQEEVRSRKLFDVNNKEKQYDRLDIREKQEVKK